MKASTAGAIAVAGLALSGCASGALRGQAAPQPAGQVRSVASAYPAAGSARGLADSIARHIVGGRDPSAVSDAPVTFRDAEYDATITNAGSPGAFTVFATATQEFQVWPSSAAIISTVSAGAPGFPAPQERARWRAAGSPPLPATAASGRPLSLPSGTFTFTPQGSTLSYRQARSMPASAPALYREVLARLRAYAGARPPGTLIARQLGFLLASAPLTQAARAAAWQALGSVPGLRLCGGGADLAGRRGRWLCVSAQGEETEVLVAPMADSLLTVVDRITRPSPLYPGVPAGSIVESDAFG
jgi:hypothetical protein